jgi:hypothetical protein
MSKTTQLVGGVTCPLDDEINETILGILGWVIAPDSSEIGPDVEWHRPDPDCPDGDRFIRRRTYDRPNFTHRQAGYWYVREWVRELIKTDDQRKTFVIHLQRVGDHIFFSDTKPLRDRRYALLMSSPREWVVAILMTLRPELFSFKDLTGLEGEMDPIRDRLKRIAAGEDLLSASRGLVDRRLRIPNEFLDPVGGVLKSRLLEAKK